MADSKKVSETAPKSALDATDEIVAWDPTQIGANLDVANIRVPKSSLDAEFASEAAFAAHVGDTDIHVLPSQDAALNASQNPSGSNPYLTLTAGNSNYGTNAAVGLNTQHRTGAEDGAPAHVSSSDRTNWDGKTGGNVGTGVESYVGLNGVVLEFRRIDDTSTIEWTQGVLSLTAAVPASTFDTFGAADTAVAAHDGNASAHGANIPTTSQKAALDASPTASGANRYVTEADLGSGGTDEKAGVSATDTTPDFLQAKFTSGDASVSITRINAGGDEQLDIRSTGAGGGEANTGENLGLGAQVYAQMNGTVLQFRSAIDSATIEWTQGVDDLSASVPANTFDAFGAAATVDSALTTHKSSGDHDARYLQTETDPVFTASPAAAVKDDGVATEYLNGTGAYSTPSAGGGEANTGENLGLGAQVYAQMNGTVLQFRSAIDSATIEWTQGVDDLSASVPANTFDAFGAAATVDSALTAHKSSGDHDARYLQTETDPVFTASPAAAVKDDGVATEYLNGTGAYSTPPGGGGGWVDGTVVNDWIDGKQDVDGSAVQTIPMSSGQTIFLDLGASSQTINFTGPDPTANQAITFKAILDNASGMTATFTYNTNALTLKTEGADYGAAATHSLLFIRTSTQFIVETGGKLVVA